MYTSDKALSNREGISFLPIERLAMRCRCMETLGFDAIIANYKIIFVPQKKGR
jgi:hypothetical protein